MGAFSRSAKSSSSLVSPPSARTPVVKAPHAFTLNTAVSWAAFTTGLGLGNVSCRKKITSPSSGRAPGSVDTFKVTENHPGLALRGSTSASKTLPLTLSRLFPPKTPFQGSLADLPGCISDANMLNESGISATAAGTFTFRASSAIPALRLASLASAFNSCNSPGYRVGPWQLFVFIEKE